MSSLSAVLSGMSLRGVRSRVAAGLVGFLLLLWARWEEAASAASATVHRHTGSFDGSDTPAGGLLGPDQMAVDQTAGLLYVLDVGAGVVDKFDLSGTAQNFAGLGSPSLDGSATQEGSLGLSGNSDIAVDNSGTASEGRIYVASESGHLYAFASDGSLVYQLDGSAAGGKTPTPTGSLDNPCGVAVDSTGAVYVAGFAADAVRKFDADGNFVSDINMSERAGSPCDLAVDSTDALYVRNLGGDVEKFAGGVFSTAAAGFPTAIGVDPGSDHLFVIRSVFFAGSFIEDYFPSGGVFETIGRDVFGGFSDAAAGVAADASGGRVFVSGQANFSNSVQVFGPVVVTVPDSVATPASGVGHFTATVNGTVDPVGVNASYRFEYRREHTSAWSATADQPVGAAGAVSADLVGLSPDATYEFRVVATNTDEQVSLGSNVLSFTTLEVPGPSAQVDVVPDPGGETAHLTGRTNPQGFETSAHFELSVDGQSWIELAAHDSSTDPALADSVSDVELADDATGLVPNTHYQVRLVASNPGGQAVSDIRAFLTDAVVPVVVTDPTGDVDQTTARVGGTINPRNSPTQWWVEYGLTASYGSSFPVTQDAYAGAGDEPARVVRTISGLQPGETYHYRVVASNEAGVAHGGDRTFVTDPAPAHDKRAYEQVSPPDKNGVDIEIDGRARAADNGDSVAYQSFSHFAGGGGSGPLSSQYIAIRRPSGWETRNINPPSDPAHPVHSSVDSHYEFSADLTKAALVNAFTDPLGGAHFNVFSYDVLTNTFNPLSRPWHQIPATDHAQLDNYLVGASADYSHIIIEGGRALTQQAEESGLPENVAARFLYEWVAGQLRLVDILPPNEGGRPAPGTASLGGGFRNSPSPLAPGQHAISDDAARIYFSTNISTCTDACAVGPRAIYLREDADLAGPDDPVTVHVDKPERAVADPDLPAFFQAASADGRYAFFTSGEKLTENATANNPAGGCDAGCDLYRFDTQGSEGQRLTDLTTADPDGGGVGATGGNTIPPGGGVVGVSDDGSRVFFEATGDLAPGGVDGQLNLYLWEEGSGVRWIAPLSPADSQAWTTGLGDRAGGASWTADGGQLVFRASARVTSYDNANTAQIYLYETAADRLVCVSCNPNSDTSTGDNWLKRQSLLRVPPWQPHNISADGQTIFFDSAEALVAGDTNNAIDVYEWNHGTAALVSGGTNPDSAAFVDASANGHDVFFVTREQLVGWDTDKLADLYDARINGGFPEPQVIRDCSDTTDCQPPPSAKPPLAQPQTIAPGNDNPPGTRPTLTTSRLTKHQLTALARGKTITLKVKTTNAAPIRAVIKATLQGKTRTIAKATKHPHTPGTTTLKLKLNKQARTHLHHHPLTITLTITTPNTPNTTTTHTLKPPKRAS